MDDFTRNPDIARDNIFAVMKMYFSNVTREAVEVEYVGWFDILVTTRSGDRYIFNELDTGIRRLPDPDDMTEQDCLYELGRRIFNIMRCRHVSQEELSDMTGIQQARISNYIRGKTSPGFFNLHKIARALDCSMDDFRVL